MHSNWSIFVFTYILGGTGTRYLGYGHSKHALKSGRDENDKLWYVRKDGTDRNNATD